ncbi:hypothetical protein EDD63_1509 [Breznakia blatticola]|uniref:Uncharacterized protein n=1 Tax=Breznakia blatticola TaxID=1754012 RepID=A0A4R7ZFS2_9FIRM|nr:hypothetical protein [Breznakia blatticola]TDW13103.1 hypothetical protein EDD63_1509 [Breznakia blatticola]
MKKETCFVRDLDKQLLDEATEIVRKKGITIKTAKGNLEYILKDYVRLQQMGILENPYFLKQVENIIDNRCNRMERTLGGRLYTLTGELAIQTGITNRLVADSVATFSEDAPEERINNYRVLAVDDLRNKKKPSTYIELIKDETEDYDG